ncbi:hypothetical protein ISU07_20130 [Nocardioides islandensis]|jgi:hypothetical protein|uniref:Uncharacterized protein n=1 Tax=Nocardioides islandensis TaxID=433663 RepID=A0A930YEI7_9ACTN|nr:hypothetical protein [Nocardioides islandensis]MBF4765446.1 hypothetical protein [Nocardioides islandensis]
MGERACVVAGAGAWSFYLATGAWVGQENRRFGGAERLGFYSGRQIHGALPRIRHVVGSVPLTPEEAAGRTLGTDPVQRLVGEALAAALHDGMASPRVAVVLLSPADDPDTLTMEPLAHDGDAAWTMFQRVVDVDRLRAASSTADLGAG